MPKKLTPPTTPIVPLKELLVGDVVTLVHAHGQRVSGYDAATVTKITDDEIRLERPYMFYREDDSRWQAGIEVIIWSKETDALFLVWSRA